METTEDDFINQEGGVDTNQPRKKKNTRKQKEQVDTSNMYAKKDLKGQEDDQQGSESEDEIFGKKKKKGGKASKKQEERNARQKKNKNKKQQDEEEEEETKAVVEEEVKEEQKVEAVEEETKEVELKMPLTVVYCQNCSMPPEYCSFNKKTDLSKCKEWLQKEHPALFEEVYPAQPEESKEGEEQKKQEQPAKKKKKVGFAAQDDVKKVIQINKLKRGGNKVVSEIYGFELFGGNLKDIAKTFGKKCACGAAAVKLNGIDCIQVQGDVEFSIYDLLQSDFASLNIPEDAIDFVDAGNKKGRKRK